MGQQSFIIIALSSLLLSISIFGFMDMWSDSSEISATQYAREQSLNIARRGVTIAMKRLRNSRTWRAGYTNMAVQGGTVSVRITDIGVDTIRIDAQGSIAGESHSILVEATISSLVPNMESALTMFGDSVSFTAAGHSWSIDGRDWKADGTLGGRAAVNGIGLRTGKAVEDLIKQLGDTGDKHHVLGVGDAPSVGRFKASDLSGLQASFISKATTTLAEGHDAGTAVYGSPSTPEIVYAPGDMEMTGIVTGHGILIVKGELLLQGPIRWKGLVCSLSGNVRLEAGALGAPMILGALWVGNGASNGATRVHARGASSIRYSSETLDTMFRNFGLCTVRVIRYFE